MSEPAPAYSMRELQRLAEAPLRRPWLVIVPLAFSLGVAVATSFLLPPRYRSSTLILVAPEQMPAGLPEKVASVIRKTVNCPIKTGMRVQPANRVLLLVCRKNRIQQEQK